MHFFQERSGELYCEDVPLTKVADQVGTPTYVYSWRTLVRHFEAFDDAFKGVPHLCCFSVKSNSSLAVLNLLGRMGAGADIVSGGELFKALRAGIPPQRIVYSGVGKGESEIREALEAGILMFNVESVEELGVIDRIAGQLGVEAHIALRINPDVDPKTHPHISTGLRENKFGIPAEGARDAYRVATEMKNVQPIGIDCHIGSQITQVEPFVEALEHLISLVRDLMADGVNLRYVDMGGGLGIRYHREEPPHPNEYAQAICERMRDMEVELILEPGRVIVGNAGILLTKVLYTKETGKKRFVIVDAGMNDLIRPSLYGSYHAIEPVVRWTEGEMVDTDVVGPICESGDFLAKGRKLPSFARGDLLAVMSAGAYGFTMASNYNSRPRAAEVLVRGDRFAVIRRREDYEDLISHEEIPHWLIGDVEGGRQA